MTCIVLKEPLNMLTIIYRKLPKATVVAFGSFR